MDIFGAFNELGVFGSINSDLGIGGHKRGANLDLVVDLLHISLILQRLLIDIYTLRCLRKLDTGLGAEISQDFGDVPFSKDETSLWVKTRVQIG